MASSGDFRLSPPSFVRVGESVGRPRQQTSARLPFLRAMGVNNWDSSLIKNTRFGHDGRFNAQFKAEFLNTLNRTQLPAPNTDPRNVLFGESRASNQANYPRRIQLTAKFIF